MSRKYGVDNANLFCVFSHFYFWQKQSFILRSRAHSGCVRTIQLFIKQKCTPPVRSLLYLALLNIFILFVFLFLLREIHEGGDGGWDAYLLHSLDSFGRELFILGHSISLLLLLFVCVCNSLAVLLAFHFDRVQFVSHRLVSSIFCMRSISIYKWFLSFSPRLDLFSFIWVGVSAQVNMNSKWKWNCDYMLTPRSNSNTQDKKKTQND